MKNAPREMKGYLDNLRSELYGERDYFKKAMRQVRSRSKSNPRDHVDCAPLKILNDSVRHLTQDFRRLERPFLEVPQEEEERDVEKSAESPYRVKYASMDFRHRYIWLRSKNDIIALADQVTRIQSRRIAFDTNTVVQYVAKTRTILVHGLTELIGRFTTLKEDSETSMTECGMLRSTLWVKDLRTAKSTSRDVTMTHEDPRSSNVSTTLQHRH